MKTYDNLPDTFQWSRFKMVARYYTPALRLPLIIYPCVSLVLGASCYYLNDTPSGVFFSSILNLILSLMFYFFPLFFHRVSNPVIETMLPATAGERLCFIVVMSLLVNSMLVYLPNWLITNFLETISTPTEFQLLTQQLSESLFTGTYGIAFFQALLPTVTCMFVVATCHRNTLGKAIGWTIATIVALSIASMIATVVLIALNIDLFDSISEASKAESQSYEAGLTLGSSLAAGLLKPILYGIGCAGLIYTALMTWLSYRKMKRCQI